jgi:hypothetical protein
VDISHGEARVSTSIQTDASSRHRFHNQEDANLSVPSQEAVMSEADLFRQYAEEAMRSSSKSTDENEKRDLIGLACIWAQAALMSERVFGSSFVSSPRDGAEVTSPSSQTGVR